MAALMAFAIAVLANTRPFEGADSHHLRSLWLLLRFDPNAHPEIVLPPCGEALLPIHVVFAITAILMGYYCWRAPGEHNHACLIR